MRIIAGRWRGRALVAPAGTATRPTSDRARQALFDILAHAPWSPGLDRALVLDAFAGTGALGLEALSRGAARAVFMEMSRAALDAIRANVFACGADARVLAADATRPPRADAVADIVFLDPPYARGLVAQAAAALRAAGWLAPTTLLVGETGREDAPPWSGELLDSRAHGAARLWFWRSP